MNVGEASKAMAAGSATAMHANYSALKMRLRCEEGFLNFEAIRPASRGAGLTAGTGHRRNEKPAKQIRPFVNMSKRPTQCRT